VTRNVSYFMVGSMGVLSAAAAKSTVVDLVTTLSASADVLALAKLEVSMASIPEGKNVIVKVRPASSLSRTLDRGAALLKGCGERERERGLAERALFLPRHHVLPLNAPFSSHLPPVAWKARLHPPPDRRRDCRG